MIRDYRELDVYQMSMDLCEKVYGLVRKLPTEERFALGDQLRRAVVSIPSNIAEGNGRGTSKDYAHFLSMARGSLFEVRTQLELAVRLGYFTVGQELVDQMESVSKMLFSMIVKMGGQR